jgi:signal transduction histidine kinase
LVHGGARPTTATPRIEQLDRVVRLLTYSFDVSNLAQPIAESVLALFRAQSSVAWLSQPDGSLSCAATAGGARERFQIGDVWPRDSGVTGRAARERRALLAVDGQEASVVRGDELDDAGRYSVLAVPLIAREEVIGVIAMEYAEPRRLARADIELVQAFADQFAPALRNVQLFARAQAARAEAEAASRAKDDFLAIIAHEVRNSLAPIVASAARILRECPPAGGVHDSAGIVRRQALHLAHLLDDLLDVARIARGRIELHRTFVSLTAAVEEAVKAARPLADVGQLSLSVSLPAGPVWIEADPVRLEQIALNVLGNAVKYTPAGGRIDVEVAINGGEALLRVSDTGIGIPPEMVPHVFDGFFRSERARAQSPDGLGIGLTLVRTLVELHGGRVAAHSDGPGRGSRFTICFPLAAEPANTATLDRGAA